MPIPRRCERSGAIIFDLTPEERTVKELTKELEEKLERANRLLNILENQEVISNE